MKKLYRSREDKMLAGVCGGIAEYFNIDSTIVRILFVLISIGGGFGILAYVALAIIMPERPYGRIDEPRKNADDFEREYREYTETRKDKNEEDFY
ncbi:PspC domain-containing protein [Peptoniphilus sp. MSJ-1]|uniref:PspC domain-containing protein n=1 Tax=Peptoniphilus ovalis TaxID=2841503 RepID=A0ABS6FJ16_9FIRM|nr:PspC domain-containing protein [Peptoniphilus ovalis]MBU5670177.1 PspC domain-containing protein [Peptoniphilus ovalis]